MTEKIDSSNVLKLIVSELLDCTSEISPESLDSAVDEILNANRVFTAAAGRSGMGIRGFAMRLMHFGKTSFLVGETTTPGIHEGDVLFIGSGSGRTASLQLMAEKAKSKGARIVLVTIDANSPIALMSDLVIVVPTVSPKVKGPVSGSSIQPMGSLFEQALVLTLDSLIVLCMEKTQINTEQMFKNHANLE